MTNLYVRDSLLIDMIADHKTRRDTGSTRRDQIGKVFIVVGQDVRKCLICDGVFTPQSAAEHGTTPCHPNDAEGLSLQAPTDCGEPVA